MRFEPTWSSLYRYKPAQWFLDAKFGVYTHWGPYSVPAYGVNGSWYPHDMYVDREPDNPAYAPTKEYHVKTYGPEFGYKDFIPLFTAEKFDPEEWAELFKQSGAQYAGPVAEHHDGFSMWPSQLSRWNAGAMGPKRDVVGELAAAIRAQDMRFVATFHHAFNWWYFPTWDKSTDCANPEYMGLYSRPHERDEAPDQEFLDIWFGKLKEVVDAYQPDMVWFDFGLGKLPESCRLKFLAYYYNKQAEWDKEVVVTYKSYARGANLPPGAGIVDFEVGKLNRLAFHPWLTDTTVDTLRNGSWSYVSYGGYKSVERLVHNLVDRVSKNGHLLLNVGPRADGTIPAGAKECLRGMGKWLAVNGEAIYGTVPWFQSEEGPTQSEGGSHFNETGEPRLTAQDIRYTTKGDAIYAICLGRPGDRVRLEAPAAYLRQDEIESVSLLGVDESLSWALAPDALTVDVPETMPCEYAVTLRIVRRAQA